MKVAILGASGFAREARSTIDDLVRAGRDFTVIGFVDVNLPIGTDVAGLPVLGNEGWFSSPEARDVRAVIGIGDPAVRRRAVEGVVKNGGDFVTIIHPSVVMGRNISVGRGCLFLQSSSLTTDISIGDFVSINPGVTIGHDATVEDFANLSPGARLSGFVRICQGADIGAGAVVLPGLTVGRDAVMGAGAVATKDVPDGLTVVGVPARTLERKP